MRVQQNYDEHGDYVLHLFDIFKSFCTSLPSKVERLKNNTIDLRFQTIGHQEFNYFGQLFYPEGKKILPSDQEISKWLTPVAFSYWYMDDGGIDGANLNGCSLNTQGFEDNDTERLIKILNEKYALKATFRINKGKKIIVIPAQSCQKVQNLLATNVVLPCMKYKIPGEK